MNHYEEGINAMWEKVGGKKTEPVPQPSDEEGWQELVEEYCDGARSFLIVFTYPEGIWMEIATKGKRPCLDGY